MPENLKLPPHDLALLRRIPEPAYPGVHARTLDPTGQVGRALRRLEVKGLVHNSKGWWRQTREGVLYLRMVGRGDA